MFKILTIAIVLSSCTVRKATLVGYDKDRMILVSADTVSYGSKNKGAIGDQYEVKFRNNKVVRIKKINR